MKRLLAFVGLLLLFVSCNQDLKPVQEVQEPEVKKVGKLVFYASFEDSSAPETKVFMNDDWQLRWNAGDQITIFKKTQDNLQFGFDGVENDPSGSFSPVDPNATIAGSAVPYIYAVYPYASSTTVASDGTISLTLPAEQSYYGGVSFGRGANTMVSVTVNDNDRLLFKNVCGYLQLKLYGDDVSISRVTLKGNNNEKLAGSATVTATTDGAPSVSMQSSATTEVSMVCTEPVKLGADADHYTTFMLAIPPTRFSGGFTITVTDSDGYVFEKKTTNDYTIGRNVIFPMAPLKCREIEEFYIENEPTRNYMAKADQYYPNDTDYTLSYVSEFRKSNTHYDLPLPFTFTVTGAKKVQIKSLSAAYPKGWTTSVSNNTVSVYNLVPGVIYHYDVLNSQGTSLKSGFVRPGGHVRMIKGFSYNVRDLGGWETNGGTGTIRYGKLYRGANVDGISTDQKAVFLDSLKISAVLDFRRTKSDGSEKPYDALKLGTNGYKNIQALKFFDNGTGNTSDLYQQALRQVITWLGQGKSIYFHCAGGADRTGTMAFLIESLLGVSECDMSKDYELTSLDGINSHLRERNQTDPTKYAYTLLIGYIRQFAGSTMQDKVVTWAKTRHSNSVDPLTDSEIEQLRNYLIVTN